MKRTKLRSTPALALLLLASPLYGAASIPTWVDIVIQAGKDLYQVYEQLMPTITGITNNSAQTVIVVGSINQAVSAGQTFAVNPAVPSSVLLQPFPVHLTTLAGTFSIGFDPLKMSIVILQTSASNALIDKLIIFDADTITVVVDAQGLAHLVGA